MQPTLFDIEEEPQIKRSLIISGKQKQPLNKQQQAFNRLINKIERLRAELEKTSARLDQQLQYYAKHIHPLEQQLISFRKEVTKLLFSFYMNKKLLVKSQKNILKKFLSKQLQEIFFMDGDQPDEELKKIYKTVNGMSFEKAADQDFELMKEELENMAEGFGFDIDLSELSKDMTEEEMAIKMKEFEEEYLKQQEGKEFKKITSKKSAKQLQKEEKEGQLGEARNKSISSIYKQLAKALHPDLERDEDRKIEKEVLMKRLTVAYNNKDLHSLLSLEMEWIHKEADSEKMSNEKLAIYNQVLKEQVQDLTKQLNTLDQHPRFLPLLRYSSFSYQGIQVNLSGEKIKIEETLNSIKDSVSRLKGKDAIKEVKAIIREVEPQFSEEESFMNMLDYDHIQFSYQKPKRRKH